VLRIKSLDINEIAHTVRTTKLPFCLQWKVGCVIWKDGSNSVR